MKSDKTSTTEKIVGVAQPRLVRLTFWYFLRWLRGPVGIAQGLAQTISFGCWEPSWILKMEGWFLDYSWEVRDLISSANDQGEGQREKGASYAN